jgi:START domain.
MLTVSGRDFVIASQRKFDEQGNLTVVAQSIEDPRVPVEKKYVRGEIKVMNILLMFISRWQDI